MAKKNFLGFKQQLLSSFKNLTEEQKKGWLWGVRDDESEFPKSELYLNLKKYGEVNPKDYNKLPYFYGDDKYTPDYLMYTNGVVTNNENDYHLCQGVAEDMADIVDNPDKWTKFGIYPQDDTFGIGSGCTLPIPSYDGTQSWYYDMSQDAIYNNVNSEVSTGYFRNEPTDDYDITTDIGPTTSSAGNDITFFILGFKKIENEIFMLYCQCANTSQDENAYCLNYYGNVDTTNKRHTIAIHGLHIKKILNDGFTYYSHIPYSVLMNLKDINSSFSSYFDYGVALSHTDGLNVVPYNENLNILGNNPGLIRTRIVRKGNKITIYPSNVFEYDSSHYQAGYDRKNIPGANLNGNKVEIDLENQTVKYTANGDETDVTSQLGQNIKNIMQKLCGPASYGYGQDSTPNSYFFNIPEYNYRLILRTDTDEVMEYRSESGLTGWFPVMDGDRKVRPVELFTGSHISFNDITKKLFYSDGNEITYISNISDGTSGDYESIENKTDTIDPYSLSGDTYYPTTNAVVNYVNNEIQELDIDCELMKFVTYDELLTLKNQGELIPGMKYRIIDYVTDIQLADDIKTSIGKYFDIIVTSSDEQTLNENVLFAKCYDPTDASFNTFERMRLGDVTTDKISVEGKVETYHAWTTNDSLSGITYTYTLKTIPTDDDEILVPFDINDNQCNLEQALYDETFKEFKSFKELGIPFDNYTSSNDYWEGCNLDAWEGKYCLEYDSDRFSFNDSLSAITLCTYGVIYHLKDEWGNEAPYDFKNIVDNSIYAPITNCFTFAKFVGNDLSDGVIDASLHGSAINNVIKPLIYDGKQVLNKTLFVSLENIKNNKVYENCVGISVFSFLSIENNIFEAKNCDILILTGYDLKNNYFYPECFYVSVLSSGSFNNNVFYSRCKEIFLSASNTHEEVHLDNNTFEQDCENIRITSSIDSGIMDNYDIRNNLFYRGSKDIELTNNPKIGASYQKVIGYRTSDNINPVIVNPLDYLISGINKTLSN